MKQQPKKATRDHTKLHNLQLVLKTLYDHDRISRADIARITHLTRTTVSDLVGDLIRQGLVEETGHGQSSGGKAPILLTVIDDARHLIGLEIAGGELRGALVNLRGQIRQRLNLSLDDCNGDEALAMVYAMIDQLLAMADRPLLGIGIGTAGLIDTANGIVIRAVNLDWRDLALRDLLYGRYKLPVYVANDSQVAALAEYIFGRERQSDNLVVIRVGDGIGAGIVVNGELFQGDGFGAGEIGHVAVVENGDMCRCGNRGCLETVASSRALVQRARRIAETEPGSLLNRLVPQPQAINLDTVLQAFDAGDESVRQSILGVGHYLGIAAANLVGTLNIAHISLAGTMACFRSLLAETVAKEMRRRSLTALADKTQITCTELGPDIVILGASALLLTQDLGLGLIH